MPGACLLPEGVLLAEGRWPREAVFRRGHPARWDPSPAQASPSASVQTVGA